MKNVILLLLLAYCPILKGQTFVDLVKEYEEYCQELVFDTITQDGYIEYKLIPVKKKRKTIHYVYGDADTTWLKPDCPEYKISWTSRLLTGNYIISLSNYNLSNLVYDSTKVRSHPIISTEKVKHTTIDISRQYVCKCKRRQVEPFSEHFWNWIKEH